MNSEKKKIRPIPTRTFPMAPAFAISLILGVMIGMVLENIPIGILIGIVLGTCISIAQAYIKSKKRS
jgi:hypothetical protein